MPRIVVSVPFRWSPNGTDILDFAPGVVEVPDRCAEVACREGWAVPFEPQPAPPRAEPEPEAAETDETDEPEAPEGFTFAEEMRENAAPTSSAAKPSRGSGRGNRSS